jgi:N-acetylglutamate synthase-like GNAT family acetyltransferase
LTAADRARLAEVIAESWGSTRMASRGRLLHVADLDGFVAEDGGEWIGYATYEVTVEAMEIAVLASRGLGSGAGSALLASCVAEARDRGLRRVWLITTNDNTDALRFYQRRGFVLMAVHVDAVTRSRESLKPEIPVAGAHDIPIRDEIELQLPRAEWDDFIDRWSWPQS